MQIHGLISIPERDMAVFSNSVDSSPPGVAVAYVITVMRLLSRPGFSLLLFSPSLTAADAGREIVEYKKALQSQSSTQISHATEQLFRKAELDDLSDDDNFSRMVLNSDDEVALAAAWRRVKAAFYLRPEMRDYRETLKAEIHRFAGNIESRLRVSVPRAWISRLNTISFQSDIDTRSADKPVTVTWDFPVWATPEIASPPADVFSFAEDVKFWKQPWVNITLGDTPEQTGGITLYVVDHPRHERQLPLSRRRRSTHCVYVAFAEDSGVAVAHVVPPKESVTYDLAIWREPKEGADTQCDWVSRRLVDGGFVLGDKTDHWGNVEFSEDGKQVVVFGVSSRVIYVEAFDVATGAVKMSFRAYN